MLLNSSKTVLVTGGAGYIGSHTCKTLFKSGYTPVVLDNLVYGHKEFAKWGHFYEGDICDTDLVSSIIQKHKIESVIHFAAYAYVGESVQNPKKYYENNLEKGIRFLDILVKNKIQRIVFSSTCATYGIATEIPISENSPTNPINPYGKTKRMFEQIMQDYQVAFGLSGIALRYFNAAGADKDLEIGEDHDPETHIIPLAIKAAMDPNYTLTVFGNDYDTKDGTCIRDYVHVTDLAIAHKLALQKMEKQTLLNQQLKTQASQFEFFNLGTGTGTSVKEIVNAIQEITNKNVKIKFGDRRAGDPAILIASNLKAKNELGWIPENSNIKNIIQTASEFYKIRFNQKG